MNELTQHTNLVVRQKFEIAEHFGFETRNKYQVLDQENREIFFVAEQQKGILGWILRQYLGHWRAYSLHFFDTKRAKVAEAHHPFKFFFQRLDVNDAMGKRVGSLQRRWSFFRRRFDVLDSQDRVLMEVKTGIVMFSKWKYPFKINGRQVAVVDKKFTGVLKELFTDSDNFLVSIEDPKLTGGERLLLIAAAVFIDLTYFENKA